jgi:CubicO group peptidase (beta-lactamase class C family)
MKHLLKGTLIIIIICTSLSTAVFSKNDTGANYWPKESWRTSTPEEQGMDPGNILEMLKCAKDKLNLHSVLIIRNGYLVTECYFDPFHRDVRHNIYSCTKSFTSALTGIAIQKGLIKDVHRKAVDYFPDYSMANLDDRKKAITIENLLTLSSGLKWQGGAEDDYRMIIARNSVQYILNQPMAAEPGTHFNYSNGDSHFLTAIIQKTSGISPWYFATKNLFRPIGISSSDWDSDSQGINWGNMGLSITPSDMARFGYLFLRRGVWNGKPIIPAEWVETSTKEHIKFTPGLMNTGSYGFLWWITSYGYFACGHGGQYIFVIPKSNMVVVVTGGSPMIEENRFDPFVEKYLIPAVKSDKPLPPNKKSTDEMKDFLREMEFPTAKPIPPLPAMAAKISGKVIQCAPNDVHYKTVTLNFQQDKSNSGSLAVTWDDGRRDATPPTVRLDGVYRIHKADWGVFAFKGAWVKDNTFMLNTQELSQPERIDMKFTFNQDDVSIDVIGSIMGHYLTIKGKLQQ